MLDLLKRDTGHRHIQRQVSACGRLEKSACFHIRRSVDSLQEIWQSHANHKSIRILTKIDQDLPDVVPFDALKLQHCLNNLVDHAVSRTKNGKILITITKISCHNRDYFSLNVQDSGATITQNEFGSLFKPASKPEVQKQADYGVVDTGLAIANRLMKDMGGKILFKSKPGRGSIFSLVLPLPKNPFPELPDFFNLPRQENPFSDLNILIVDDYNLNQLTIKALLQDTVAKTHIASHGYEAMEVLNSCPIDIILMDIHMPIMDGIETTMRIRASHNDWSKVKIVALTADPYYQHGHLCEKIGMNAALAKPVNRLELLQIFGRLTSGPNKDWHCNHSL